MEKNLKQLLHDALLGGDGSITMTEFTQAFEAIVAQILKFEKKLLDKNTEVSDELTYSLTVFKKQLENSSKERIVSIKEEVMVSITTAIDTLYKKINAVQDGHTPTKTELLDIILPLLPTESKLKKLIKPLIPEPIPGSEDTGEEIISKVNNDKSDHLIRKGKIEGMEELESAVRTVDATTRLWSNSGSFVYAHDISASLDGVTKTFTLVPNARVILVFGSSVPGVFRPTVDYTTTSSEITFTDEITASSTLATGQTVILLYKIL